MEIQEKSAKIYVCQYLKKNTLTNEEFYQDSDKKESLMITRDIFYTVPLNYTLCIV